MARRTVFGALGVVFIVVLVAAIALSSGGSDPATARKAPEGPGVVAAAVDSNGSKVGAYVLHVNPTASPQSVSNWIETVMPGDIGFSYQAGSQTITVQLRQDTPEIRTQLEREANNPAYVASIQRCPCS